MMTDKPENERPEPGEGGDRRPKPGTDKKKPARFSFGWVLLLVLGGLGLLLTGLTAAAVSGKRRGAAPWDRSGKAGNPLSREPI
mgnify:CR=1 FL=1